MTAEVSSRPSDVEHPAPGAEYSATTAADPSAEKAKAKPRDPYFSNAKLFLIVLVVCGHAWAGLIEESYSVRAFYMTVYDFHMPAFILLCGYFSKSFTGRPEQLRRLVAGVLGPYLIFSVLYGIQRGWIEGDFGSSLLYPYYLTWFLAALFVWRVTAPFWRIVKHPVIIATLISLGSIMMNLPSVLDLGRILQFLPFFVAGMYLKREHFEKLKHPLVRFGGLLLSLGVVATFFMIGGELNRNWVYFNEGAAQMHIDPLVALPMKMVLMLTSVTLLVTFFAWVPDRQLWFSRFGEYTMFAFLLHGFFTKGIEDGLGWYDFPIVHTWYGAITITVLAVGLAFALMTKPVRWATRPLVEPNLNWLFSKSPPEAEKKPVG